MRHVASGHFVLGRDVLSRKFWSAENFGPGDQNSWKIGPPDHYFLKILVRAWNYGPSENTLV